MIIFRIILHHFLINVRHRLARWAPVWKQYKLIQSPEIVWVEL